MGWFGVVMGHSRSLEIAPFDSEILVENTRSKPTPPLLVPPLEVTPFEFRRKLLLQKTTVPGLSYGLCA